MSETPRSSNRLVRGLLFGSLCLNLALGGYLGSQLLFASEFRPLAALRPGRLMEVVSKRLSPEDAAKLQAAYQSRQDKFAAARADFHASVTKVLDVISQPQLDAKALRAAIDEARAKRAVQHDLAVDVFIDALQSMSASGRSALVARFRRAHERMARFSEH